MKWTHPSVPTPRVKPRYEGVYPAEQREGPKMEVTTLGIDLAKNVFQLHGVDVHGKIVLQKKIQRRYLLEFMVSLPPCLIGMEACGGAHHWGREFQRLGHAVRLIPGQFVKPYVKSNKNDANDAEAICEAVARPNMRFVPVKTIEQHDLQAMHCVREQIIKSRTALANQIRGLLCEYGLVIPQGIEKVRKAIPLIAEDAGNVLTDMARSLVWSLYEALVGLDERLVQVTRLIEQICRSNEVCQRLVKVEGIGPITATALVAAVGDARHFNNGRQFAAWIGLVPRQQSSGGKSKLLGISKRGNSYLRKQLVHGARSVVYRSRTREDTQSHWLHSLEVRRGMNRATVARANKAARIAWVLMAKEESYRPAAA